MSLIGAIDDATGKVPYALFRDQEDSQGYFILLRGIVSRHGIPLAIYHGWCAISRHSIFEVSPDECERQTIQEQLAGKPMFTQFGRLTEELGITSISARSPQATGRIESAWGGWGTFPDRLVSELRLAEVSTIEAANRFLEGFLERYNARFVVPPEEAGSAYRSTQGLDLETLFCFKHDRVVGADNVVRFNGRRLQILLTTCQPSLDRLSYARCTVEVHEHMDGTIKVHFRGHYLDTCPAPAEATRSRHLVSATAARQPQRPARPPTPAQDHPWRRWVYRANRE